MWRSTTRNLMWQLRLRSLNFPHYSLRPRQTSQAGLANFRPEANASACDSEVRPMCTAPSAVSPGYSVQSECKLASSDVAFASHEENMELSKSPCPAVLQPETRDFHLPQRSGHDRVVVPRMLRQHRGRRTTVVHKRSRVRDVLAQFIELSCRAGLVQGMSSSKDKKAVVVFGFCGSSDLERNAQVL